MAPCIGCSKCFKNLSSGTKCAPCSRLPPNPREDWALCSACGMEFEFWTGTECLGCQSLSELGMTQPLPGTQSAPATSAPPGHQSMLQSPMPLSTSMLPPPAPIVASTRYAVTHPSNPRTHSNHGMLAYYNPMVQGSCNVPNESQFDPRHQSAEITMQSFHNAYVAAHGAGHSAPPAKSKAKVAPSPTKAEAAINVVIRNIINAYDKKLKFPFNPQMTTYREGTPWSVIAEEVKIWLDGIYTKHNHRIHLLDDFSLQFTHSKTLIPMVPDDGTIGHVWNHGTQQMGLHVSEKHARTNILELDAYVEYPVMTDENGVRTPDRKQRGRPKRRLSTSPDIETRLLKKTTIAGPGAYRTNIRPIVDQTPKDSYVVKKISLDEIAYSSEDHSIEWVASEKDYNITIEKQPFQTGTTKHAFKLRFEGKLYAAKAFYNIGKHLGTPSFRENDRFLKKELSCSRDMKSAVERFSNQARAARIPIYDLRVADGFLLTVCQGSRKGQTWIVDPLLDSNKFRKFSGTDSAGTNSDFMGMTCDAFAHWVLFDSDNTCVPVDIQGIEAPLYVNGLRGASTLFLFDLMAHTANKSMGLGDQGIQGIKKFLEQHCCNDICKRFELPPTECNLHGFASGDEDEDEAEEYDFFSPRLLSPEPTIQNDDPAQFPSLKCTKIDKDDKVAGGKVKIGTKTGRDHGSHESDSMDGKSTLEVSHAATRQRKSAVGIETLDDYQSSV